MRAMAPVQRPSSDSSSVRALPPIDLRQLRRLSDDTGILQHAAYAVPDPHHGYCIDDNARALIAAVLHAQLCGHDDNLVLLHRYLSFLVFAYHDKMGTFRNFLAYDRHWLEESSSHDSQGRTIWALGLTVRMAPTDDIRQLARMLFERALPGVERLTPIRSWAFALIGLDFFLQSTPDHSRAAQLRNLGAQRLFDQYKSNATADWPWWEDELTYANAKLPHALLVCGARMGRSDMVEAADTSLRWLLDVQTAADGHLSFIGNQGWMRKTGQKAPFDQQPIEGHALVSACLAAGETTDDPIWVDEAWRCFGWFLGRNDLGVPLYNDQTGGCHDGLNRDGPNVNQGAESSLAYLLSVLELHHHHRRR